MKKSTLFIVALVILVVAFLIGSVAYIADKESKAGQQLSEAKTAALGRLQSPMVGKMDAPVVIVEFLDPACDTCAAFYPMVKQIMAANPGRIRLIIRYAPFHQGSDRVVAALEATRKQGKFWQALEALLASQEAWAPNHTAQVDLIWKQWAGLGLDLDRVRADMLSPEIAKTVAQDIEDARTMEVKATPEYFVNGRGMPDFGEAQLRKLIADALRETAPR
jgi:protein-disulfide isomerase